MTLPASPALCQPSTASSAATANTPNTVLIASKATDVTHASTPLARLPWMPNAARVNVIVGRPARTPAIDAQPTYTNRALPRSTAMIACQTVSPRPKAITPTVKKNRYAFAPTQKKARSRSVMVRSASGM